MVALRSILTALGLGRHPGSGMRGGFRFWDIIKLERNNEKH